MLCYKHDVPSLPIVCIALLRLPKVVKYQMCVFQFVSPPTRPHL
jgi:hypothetical protein